MPFTSECGGFAGLALPAPNLSKVAAKPARLPRLQPAVNRKARALLDRFGKGQLFAFRRQHVEDVERHRDEHVVAEDADQFDHGLVAE